MLNMPALLLAIAMVESGNDPSAVGRKGEISQFQIKPSVWKLYTSIPANKAGKSAISARRVASDHLKTIRNALPPDLKQSPYWIAVVWNGGPSALNAPTKKVKDYANRVVALYWFYDKDSRGIQELKHEKTGR